MSYDVNKLLSDKNVRIGVEFEFLIPNLSKKDKNRLKNYSAISLAYYEYDIYEREFEKYIDGITKKLPKLPKYARDLGYKSGDIIPEPDEVLKKPKQLRRKFLKIVDYYLYLVDWPIEKPYITINQNKRKQNRWVVKPELTLNGTGFEIASPVLTLSEFNDIIPKMFECINKYCRTNNSCGLHISLSFNNIPNLRKRIDTVKLVSYVNEKYIYNLFPNRRYNKWVYSIHKDLKDNYKALNKIKVNKDKFLSINLRHLSEKNQYVEFRYLGGSKYQRRWKDIKKVTAMYIYAMKMACNDKNKTEYRERLNKLIGEKF